jgi:hypothetical protein
MSDLRTAREAFVEAGRGLVQTGRMTGQAPIQAQEYQQQCSARGETAIEF